MAQDTKKLVGRRYQNLIKGQTRKQIGTRVSQLRKKKQRTFAEQDLLTDWDATKTSPGEKKSPLPTSPDVTPPPSKEKSATVGGGEKASETSPPSSPPDKPPRVLGGGHKGGDWRDKYGHSSLGREGTCAMAAEVARRAMELMHDDIVKHDGKPAFSQSYIDGEFFNCCVIAFDDLLPENFVITPAIMAGGTSTVLMTQTWTSRRRFRKKKPEKDAAAAAGKYGGPSAKATVEKQEAAPDEERVKSEDKSETQIEEERRVAERVSKTRGTDPDALV